MIPMKSGNILGSFTAVFLLKIFSGLATCLGQNSI